MREQQQRDAAAAAGGRPLTGMRAPPRGAAADQVPFNVFEGMNDGIKGAFHLWVVAGTAGIATARPPMAALWLLTAAQPPP